MRPRSTIATGVAIFVLSLVVLLAVQHQPQPPYPKAQAAAAAERNPYVRQFLAQNRSTRHTVIPLDRQHWRVTYWDGHEEVLDLAIDKRGQVNASEEHPPGGHPPGARLLHRGPLVVLLALLFVMAVAVRPLRSLRNLDAVVASAAFTGAAVLIDDRFVAARVWAGAAGLAYFAVRFAQHVFGRGGARPGATKEPLIAGGRLLALIALGVLVGGALIVVTSEGASDVAFAGLAGGTLLNHGTSPYGHLPPDVVHGDTYPPLTYILYMPVAALKPVRDGFDSLDGALWLNAFALAAVAAILWRSRGRVRWALAWLVFPPVLLAASGGGNDLLAAAFAAAALVVLDRTTTSAGLLTLAGWVKIGPAAALLPLVARLRGGPLARALAVAALISAAGLGLLLALGATHAAVDGIRFQLDRGSWFSPWQQLGSHTLQLVFEAFSFGLIAAAAVVAARGGTTRAVAAGGMTIALLQLGANYWTFAYLPWLLPFMLVALFPPALRDSQLSEQPAP